MIEEALDIIKAADHSTVKIELVILYFNIPGLSGPETFIERKKLYYLNSDLFMR
jgi:hypothetical protein